MYRKNKRTYGSCICFDTCTVFAAQSLTIYCKRTGRISLRAARLFIPSSKYETITYPLVRPSDFLLRDTESGDFLAGEWYAGWISRERLVPDTYIPLSVFTRAEAEDVIALLNRDAGRQVFEVVTATSAFDGYLDPSSHTDDVDLSICSRHLFEQLVLPLAA
jgi:hypothetical protein